jgi:hypothetical protein
MDEEDVPQDMELEQPALVLSEEASDNNDLPRLVRSDNDSSEPDNEQQQGTQVNTGVPTKERVASTKWKTCHCKTKQVNGLQHDDNDDDDAEEDDNEDRYVHQAGSLRRLEEARDQVHKAFWSSNQIGQGLDDTIIELTAAAHEVQQQAVRVAVQPSVYKWKLDEEIFDGTPEQRERLTALMHEWEDQSREISKLGVVDRGKFNATITLKDPSCRLHFQKHRQLNPARKKWLML